MDFKSGDILFDKYHIEKRLGEGTFGEVYLVTHLKLDLPRAVKLLQLNDQTSAGIDFGEIRQRFQQEAQIGARINHPGLIRVFDFDETPEIMSISMEYASGGSLQNLIYDTGNEYGMAKKSGLEISRAIEIASQMADGLAAIHALDIIHRDLKPSNILFDESGNAKISDLGLAQLPLSQPSQTSRIARMTHPGTPAYMSPEQENNTLSLKPPSDVYTFGLILFEMLTVRNYKNLRPGTRARELRADVPQWVDDLLADCLSDDPEQRPWSGEELSKLFQAHTGSNQSSEIHPAPEPVVSINTPPSQPAFDTTRILDTVKSAIKTDERMSRVRQFDINSFLKQYWKFVVSGILVIALGIVLLITVNNPRPAAASTVATATKVKSVQATSKPAPTVVRTVNAEEIKPVLGKWQVSKVVGFPEKGRPWQDLGNILEFRSTGYLKIDTYDGKTYGNYYNVENGKVTFVFEKNRKEVWSIALYKYEESMQLRHEGTTEIIDLKRVK